jgi:hypothetical protein
LTRGEQLSSFMELHPNMTELCPQLSWAIEAVVIGQAAKLNRCGPRELSDLSHITTRLALSSRHVPVGAIDAHFDLAGVTVGRPEVQAFSTLKVPVG